MAVVKDVHQPTLSSTSSVTVFIVDANDHAPAWVVPSSLNTTLVRVSSYTAVGTPVARVRAVDADDGDNARLTYSTASGGGKAPDDDLPFDVDPDTGIVRLRYDLSTTV